MPNRRAVYSWRSATCSRPLLLCRRLDRRYDAEPHHRFLRHDLRVRGVIPPTRGRPRKDPGRPPGGRHRAALARRWPKHLYGQRWQVETDFSMLKRLLDAAVRSRRPFAINREILLRVITINLMILLCLWCSESLFNGAGQSPIS